MFLVSKPSWSLGVTPQNGAGYAPVFDETLRIGKMVSDLGIIVYPVLGVHPAEISRLAEHLGLTTAAALMMEGLEIAARYVRDGKAVALKSGRPHYEVSDEVWSASNDVLNHALQLSKECGCALQIHAESGPCADIIEMAKRAGMQPGRVVKHYASPDTPLVPSLIAKNEAIPALCKANRRFMMESDYMDENSRPGAVIGPKSVPRFTKQMLEQGLISQEDCHRIHAETVEMIYGVPIVLP
jgi:TatD-related deoxyribonuclease